MQLFLRTWLFLPPMILAFQQNQYKVIFERVEIVDYNLMYVSFAKTHNFKYNRTNAVVNMTFAIIQDFLGKLDMEVQTYKFTSNEYRLFPMRFSFNFCDYVRKNEIGMGELYRCGNLTGCPFKKGVHHVCKWAINSSRCPPYIPKGSYMFDLKVFYRDSVMIFFQLFASIKYPEV